jgi:hypothetical protein
MLTADGESVVAIAGGPDSARGTYTTETNKDPARVDVSAGPEGLPTKGIYKRGGDTPVLCLAQDRDDRPAAFESKAGSKASEVTPPHYRATYPNTNGPAGRRDMPSGAGRAAQPAEGGPGHPSLLGEQHEPRERLVRGGQPAPGRARVHRPGTRRRRNRVGHHVRHRVPV